MAYLTKDEVRRAGRSAVFRDSRHYSAGPILEGAKASVSNSDSFDVFLSHSVKDAEIVLGVKSILEAQGLKVYVDWAVDSSVSRDTVSAETAEMLRVRMKQSKSLIYIATGNSTDSKWMPWELGYFDGQSSGSVSIMPILDYESSSFNGQEYLGLYPKVTKERYNGSAREGIFVKKPLKGWLTICEFANGYTSWKAYG